MRKSLQHTGVCYTCDGLHGCTYFLKKLIQVNALLEKETSDWPNVSNTLKQKVYLISSHVLLIRFTLFTCSSTSVICKVWIKNRVDENEQYIPLNELILHHRRKTWNSQNAPFLEVMNSNYNPMRDSIFRPLLLWHFTRLSFC